MSVNEKMTAIADAIRGKTGKAEPLTLDQMATEIAGIQVGGGGGTGGIGAVKFIDVDVTVEASTTTAVTYTVDGLEFISSVESPTKWNSFSNNDTYVFFITPKEITGTATGAEISIWKKTMIVGCGNTNYTPVISNLISSGKSTTSNTYGIYGATLMCTNIVNGKPTGYMTVKVRHHPSNGYEVLAGMYNVQAWYMTDFNWGM